MTVSTDPFAAAKAAAKARDDQKAELAEQARLAAEEAREATKAQLAEQKHVEALRFFGGKFLQSVATKVVKPDWALAYIENIQAYAEALLCQTDKVLPRIDQRHVQAILDKFQYGLTLAADHGVVIEDGFFFGQRLLAERAAEQATAKPERIVIRPGDKPKAPSEEKIAEVIDLKPAITPKGTPKGRRSKAS